MVFNNNWLSVYYYSPISEIDKLVEDIKKENYGSPVVHTEIPIIEKPPIIIEKPPIIIEKPPIIIPTDFGSKPFAMTCPNCLKPITTKTESSLNCLACCCCLFFGLLYFIFQAVTKKNICCVDITHKCPICGAVLGYYKSC